MGPLQGVKIIEMAAIGPVPFCGMLLADMGAFHARHQTMISIAKKSFATGE